NDKLKKGELVAYIQTSALLSDIVSLETGLVEFAKEPRALSELLTRNLQTGDLQGYVNAAAKTLQDYLTFVDNRLQEKQVAHLHKQIVSFKRLNQNLLKQLTLMKKEGVLTHRQYQADSLLLAQRVIAPLDFNKSESAYLLQQRGIKSMEASVISNQLQIDALEKQVTELDISRQKEEIQLQTSTDHAIKELTARLKGWKENFLFISPTDGTLAYLGFLENEQYVENGKPIFAILPFSNQLIARAELPLRGSGKVKTGQFVTIRLASYPFEQFGMLEGTIAAISQVPEKESYYVIINLPKGMASTYNKNLAFRPELQGETEIITEDLRLLERIFYQFRKLIRQSADSHL
ncbi:MAG: HlyD family secretion protein, partial [Cyclobacteriaceae bacterium]|nr:HlyD family secretion protein [Cyclobacteriaceae bacterium]